MLLSSIFSNQIHSMKKLVFPILALVFTLSLMACSGSNQKQENSEKESSADNMEASVSDINSPCQLITAKDVRQRFAIPDSTNLDQQDKVLTYPTCIYKWKGGLTQTKTIGGTDYTIDLKSELFIVMFKGATEKNYQASIKVYPDGKAISSIGEKATWSDERSQLSFLAKGYLFHITVKAYEDNAKNKQQAMGVAKEILGKL